MREKTRSGVSAARSSIHVGNGFLSSSFIYKDIVMSVWARPDDFFCGRNLCRSLKRRFRETLYLPQIPKVHVLHKCLLLIVLTELIVGLNVVTKGPMRSNWSQGAKPQRIRLSLGSRSLFLTKYSKIQTQIRSLHESPDSGQKRDAQSPIRINPTWALILKPGYIAMWGNINDVRSKQLKAVRQ
jgi:hypothetical protein